MEPGRKERRRRNVLGEHRSQTDHQTVPARSRGQGGRVQRGGGKIVYINLESPLFIVLCFQVETNAHDEKIKIPIAVLKVGENRCAQSFVEFPDAPVTFKLIQGSGPVHIHGQHLICDESVEGEIPMEDDDDLDEEEVSVPAYAARCLS